MDLGALGELLCIVFKLASEYESGFQTKKAKLYGDIICSHAKQYWLGVSKSLTCSLLNLNNLNYGVAVASKPGSVVESKILIIEPQLCDVFTVKDKDGRKQ